MSSQLLAVFLSTAQPWQVEVTGYCPCALCCGRWAEYGVTASGAPAQGKLVAAPPEIPFGTRIYIAGYSDDPVPVLDRGGAIKGNKLDLLFPTHAQAARWGKRKMTVYTSPRGLKGDNDTPVAASANRAPPPPALPSVHPKPRNTGKTSMDRDPWSSHRIVVELRLSREMRDALRDLNLHEWSLPDGAAIARWLNDEPD